MPCPLEIRVELLDDAGKPAGPVAIVGRPYDEPVRGRISRRARWLVVAADGAWLACGLVRLVSRESPIVVHETPDLVPSQAILPIGRALDRAARQWRRILDDEAVTRDRLHNRRANLVAAMGRLDSVNREIADLAEQIAVLEADLAPDPSCEITTDPIGSAQDPNT